MLKEKAQHVSERLTKPKVVIWTMTVALIVAATCIVLGVIVAMIGPPGGYNITVNYISDLGGSPYTPFPYFLDIAAITSGILLIPTLLYLKKILVPLPESPDALRKVSRFRKILWTFWIIWFLGIVIWFISIRLSFDMNIITQEQASFYYYLLFPILLWMIGLLMLFLPISKFDKGTSDVSRMRIRLGYVASAWILVGFMGWFFVGVFSEDRTTHYGLHFWASILCFSGLALGGFFFGLVLTFYDTIFPRALGVYTVIVPTITCVTLITTLLPIVEWIFFFSVFGWMIPGFILLLKHLKQLQ